MDLTCFKARTTDGALLDKRGLLWHYEGGKLYLRFGDDSPHYVIRECCAPLCSVYVRKGDRDVDHLTDAHSMHARSVEEAVARVHADIDKRKEIVMPRFTHHIYLTGLPKPAYANSCGAPLDYPWSSHSWEATTCPDCLATREIEVAEPQGYCAEPDCMWEGDWSQCFLDPTQSGAVCPECRAAAYPKVEAAEPKLPREPTAPWIIEPPTKLEVRCPVTTGGCGALVGYTQPMVQTESQETPACGGDRYIDCPVCERRIVVKEAS